MTSLRLIADDLTGALDTAAEFAVAMGPVRVAWSLANPGDERLALDCGTREADAPTAARVLALASESMALDRAEISFIKLDSLLRGHAGREIIATMSAVSFDHVVIAPAFPFQHRVTRGGRQLARFDGRWCEVGEDLPATFREQRVRVALARPGDPVPGGASLWDAQTQQELEMVVATARAAGGRVLWCGCGGLAAALAGPGAAGRAEAHVRPIAARPVLGLFGTDHPVTVAQLARIGDLHLRLEDGGPSSRARLAQSLRDRGAAFASFSLPERIDRRVAACCIQSELARLLDAMEPPAVLVCGGGKTLRSLCGIVGADSLEVTGRVVPGVPRSTLRGGRWAGVEVISKSGAFGDADQFRRMLASCRGLEPGPGG